MRFAHISHAYIALHNFPGVTILVTVDDAHGGAGETRFENMNMMLTYNRWRAYNRTRDALKRLGDRGLADLGINRGDIDEIARRSL